MRRICSILKNETIRAREENEMLTIDIIISNNDITTILMRIRSH